MASLARLGSSIESHLPSSFSSLRRHEGSRFIGLHIGNCTKSLPRWHTHTAQHAQSLTCRGRYFHLLSPVIGQEISPEPSGAPSPEKKRRQGTPQRQEHLHTPRYALQQALLQHDHHRLIDILSTMSEDTDFVRDIPENTFAEILTTIHPNNALSWAKYPYLKFSTASAERLGAVPFNGLIREYLCKILNILAKRKGSGQPLEVVDYCRILEISRWAGYKNVAESFWKSMEADNVAPNLKCYNNYLGAVVSNLRFHSEARHKRRLTTFNSKARLQENLGSAFAAYRFGDNGIKEQTMNIYRQMIKKNIVADEETFRILILGVGREGDLDTVKKILKQVWGLDVDALVNSQEATVVEPQTELDPSSPLYPSPFLLYSIAHTFGINNDIPTALSIVDYMSRTFDVPIFDYVWHELFNWTFVLSLPRHASKGEHAYLPKNSVQKLWNVMLNPPYNVRPTLDMYDKLIKSFFVQQRTKDMWHYMNEARPLYEQTREKASKSYRALRHEPKRSDHGNGDDPFIRHRINRTIANVMMQKRARLWLKRWVRLLLASMRSWRKVDRNLFWSTVQIPRMIHDWNEFLPSKVWYDIPGGRVSFHVRTHEQKLAFHEKVTANVKRKARIMEEHGHQLPGQMMIREPTRRMEKTRLLRKG